MAAMWTVKMTASHPSSIGTGLTPTTIHSRAKRFFRLFWCKAKAANICRTDVNDIGLLRMKTYKTTFPPSVGTICLPSMSIPDSEVITALGWGGTNSRGKQSSTLKEVYQ